MVGAARLTAPQPHRTGLWRALRKDGAGFRRSDSPTKHREKASGCGKGRIGRGGGGGGDRQAADAPLFPSIHLPFHPFVRIGCREGCAGRSMRLTSLRRLQRFDLYKLKLMSF